MPGRRLREASAANLTSDRGGCGGGSSAANCAIDSSVAGCDAAAPVLEQLISTLVKVLKKSAEKISSEMAAAVAEEALRQTVARQEAVAEALHSQLLNHDREMLDLLTRVKLRDQELDLNREILKRRESEAQALVDRSAQHAAHQRSNEGARPE